MFGLGVGFGLELTGLDNILGTQAKQLRHTRFTSVMSLTVCAV